MNDTYTHGHHESVLRSHTWRTVENSASYLLRKLRAGATVLDVGCGPGTITCDIAARVAPGAVIGIDPADDVIAKAAADTPANVTNVKFTTGDVYALGYPDASFDIVHAHQVLQHLSDPVGALREMRRVLKPGGVLAARDSIYSSKAWGPAEHRLDEWLRVYLAVARHNDAEPDAGRYLSVWAHEAGLVDIAYTTSTWTFADPETRAWWSSLWADRCRLSAFAEQAQRYGIATVAELEAMAQGYLAWAAHPAASFVVVHGEILATRT